MTLLGGVIIILSGSYTLIQSRRLLKIKPAG